MVLPSESNACTCGPQVTTERMSLCHAIIGPCRLLQ